ncbi:hypothetical protein ACFQHW_07220 [Lapidilactobacillus achengensis]|uniref:Transposase n=1 Tax=Lapidilactobacillus achengensis TaxID=2486000 RepID=A0ABW1UNW3_9LACO|nr:hypothetical protein [Lapidilactobacillus achengensis]
MVQAKHPAEVIDQFGNLFELSVEIRVSNDKIVRFNKFLKKTSSGSFKSSELGIISSTKAQWTGVYHLALIAYDVSCTATIPNQSLHVV